MTTSLQKEKTCQLILALDIEEKQAAINLLKQAGDELEWVKIGLQMFCKYGPDYVREIADLGKNIFLDLKLHDIPNTVAKAVQSVSQLPISMLTIHACGGREMMQWAVQAQQDYKPDLQLLGVTVLTSTDDSGLQELGIEEKASDRVISLAGLAQTAGMSGLICSTHEVAALREKFGDHFALVTPGIRPAGSDAADQKRIMTPAQAAQAGSTYIVVGRPIHQAKDPAAAVASIRADLEI
ncbi:MAG: orotidine-5'-phosphate decarboxylase [Verrucomicrobiota bacterium]